MPFIGNQPALSYTSFAKQDFTTSATTSYTLDNPVANANELALFINFVRQEPTTAYSASGTTLTLTSATSSSDDMYCVYLGKAVQTVNPPNASVGASQIVDASITSGKLASGVLPTNTPSFLAYRTSYQSISNSTDTKVQNNIELYDTDNAYDNSTNYRFTVPSGGAGKYLIGAGNTIDNVTDQKWVITRVRKNGSDLRSYIDSSSGGFPLSTELTFVDNASDGDYYESWVKHLDGSTSDLRTEYTNYFWMMRIIGA